MPGSLVSTPGIASRAPAIPRETQNPPGSGRGRVADADAPGDDRELQGRLGGLDALRLRGTREPRAIQRLLLIVGREHAEADGPGRAPRG